MSLTAPPSTPAPLYADHTGQPLPAPAEQPATSLPLAPTSDTSGDASPEVSKTSEPKESTSSPQAPPDDVARGSVMTTLGGVSGLLCVMVGVIGFAMSFETLSTHAHHSWGFGQNLAKLFPIGVDASIIAFLALDLYLIMKGAPWPALRFLAHGMTAATVYFNASSYGSIRDAPVQALAHGLMPVLFVVGVEALRRLIIKKARLQSGTAAEAIPLNRWILFPFSSLSMYRRMRRHMLSSYQEILRRDRELDGYKLWLERTYDGDLGKATADELLPLTMAKHGYTVAQALALPEQQEKDALERQVRRAERLQELETQKEINEMQATARKEQARGDLELTKLDIQAQMTQARSDSERQATTAQREAQRLEELAETAELRQAAARAAETEIEAAEKEQAAAEARQKAAEADQQADEAEHRANENRARNADLARRAKADEAATKRASAEADEAAARATEARAKRAEAELRAIEAEDLLKLKPTERRVRKIARLVLVEAGGIAEELPLRRIVEECGVAESTASGYRDEAADLLTSGYRPEIPTPA